MASSVPSEIIIIGTGIFGLSTAISLAKRHPVSKIHVIDRFEPPVADGTSVDTTRCLRSDYNDQVYEKLSFEAMELTRNDPEIAPFFHECGMSVVYDGKQDKWAKMYEADKASAERVLVKTPEKILEFNGPKAVFKSIHGDDDDDDYDDALEKQGKTLWNHGYCNKANGFIDAAKAIKAYYKRAKSFPNVQFTFQAVERLVYEKGTNKATGVELINGTIYNCELVIVAAGAWSAKLVDLEGICFSTAIEVAWYKVTKEEENKWKDMAITTNLSTGINLFPPYEGEIKILRRSAGYKNTVNVPDPNPMSASDSDFAKTVQISHPRTIVDHPEDWIPADAEMSLRENMKEIMPPLFERPFDRTKLCWLTQTRSANFLIDYHPNLENVLLTTGGSAHAWKFVALIGDKVVDLMEGELDSELRKKWSWEEKLIVGEQDNGSAPRMNGEVVELTEKVRDRTNQGIIIV